MSLSGARNIWEAGLIRAARISVWRSGRRHKRFLDPSVVARQGNEREGRFPALRSARSATARWDHHGDRRPHTFIPRDVSP